MSERSYDDAELLRLIDDWCEGAIRDEDAVRLNEILQKSPAARKEFLEAMEVHGLLALGESQLTTGGEATSGPIADHPIRRTAARVRQFFAQPTPLSMSVAALFLAVLMTLMAFIAPPVYRAITRQEPEPGEVLGIVAEVNRTLQATWEDEHSRPHVGAFLVAGRTLELKSGLVELEYRNGARVILQGPVTFVVGNGDPLPHGGASRSCGLGELKSGALTANLAGVPKGQAVTTPWGAIVHIGTEFGVILGEEGDSKIEVFDGEVELRSLSSGQSHPLERLSAGQSRTVSRNGVVRKADDSIPARFVRSSAFNDLHDKRADLVALWRFDDADRLGQPLDSSLPALSAVADARFTPDGRYGGALLLDGNGDMLRANEPIPRLPVGSAPYTVAAWIKPSDVGRCGIIGWGAYGQDGRVNALRLEGDNGFIHYWWAGRSGKDLPITGDVVSEHGIDVDSGKWLHVAVTWDRRVRRLYLNGQLVAEDQPPAPNVANEQFAIGRTAPQNKEFFAGTIDDVAIFRVALSSREIAAVMNGDALRTPHPNVVEPGPTPDL